MVSHDRFLYVYGGCGGGAAESTLPNDLHCFDLDSHVWSTVIPAADSQMPSGRLYHAATVINDCMFVFGGTIEVGGVNMRSNEMYKFQFSTYPKCTLSEDFGKLLNSKQFCDVVFIVGPEETKIPAHIALIAARSQFLKSKISIAKESRNIHFEKLFGTTDVQFNAELPQLEVFLPNVSPKPFSMVLHYIYTDVIDLQHISDKKIVAILNVYVLAQEFNMPSLEHLCMQYLELKISKTNVLEAITKAVLLDLHSVKDFCMYFIVKEDNFNDIVMSPEFANIEKNMIIEIIRKKQNTSKIVYESKYDKSIGTTLENDMAVFLKSSGADFCDIDLILDNHVIPGHKSILAARCAYFQAMFRSFNPTDNTVNIQIGDVKPSFESFNSLLRFIYYGDTSMPTEDSLYLFQAPSFYVFTNNRLQAFCKHNLENNIMYDNVLQILEASDKMNVPDIKSYALRMIVHDFGMVGKLPKIKTLSRDLLLDIINAVSDVMGETRLSQDMISHLSINSDI